MFQAVKICKTGIIPLAYSFATLENDGKDKRRQTMSFENGEWIQYDSETNKKIIVKKNLLEFGCVENNEFPLASKD
jgi:hypothetical protein